MPPYHSAFFIALLSLLILFLTARVIAYRFAHKIAYGDAGDKQLARIRGAHSNCIETTAVMALLLLSAELLMDGAGKTWFAVASAFLVGRLLHAHGMLAPSLKTRQIGMVLSLLSIGIMALWVLYLSLAPLLN